MTAPTAARALAPDGVAPHRVPAPATVPALRRLPVPVAEPHPGLRLVGPPPDDGAGGQLALPLAWAPDLALGDGAVPDEPPATAPGAGPEAGPVSAVGTPCLPEPRAWAARFVVAAVEVCAGLRPAAQLARWTTTDVLASLHRRGRLAAVGRRASGPAGGRSPRVGVRRVVVCATASGALEVSAVVADHRRVRAVALRLEDAGGRWTVSALEVG